MATFVDGPVGSYQANIALEAFRAVKLTSAGKLTYPTAVSDKIFGITQAKVAADEMCPVRFLNASGTHKVALGNDAVTMAAGGVPLFLAAANGLFVDTDPGSGVVWFNAIESCDASGICEAHCVKLY